MKIYDFEVSTANGKKLQLEAFKNQPILIVNTATKCGLAPQFEGLEKLHQDYKEDGLVVLGFPCNQFAGQEPETNESMEEACKINHGVTFLLTQKIDVNGSNTYPIFKYLKQSLPGTLGKRIKWNFTKFLIAPNGEPYKRYAPTTSPAKIEKDIKQLLNNAK
ncbi:glutathione peroxidase [Zunongwangia sp. HGR-M22]|uniref:glutathione peroxidase n=1 Tax=Zunongwangia sp. HGR-M22 TaxID=3015168 RepID=UPI0022DE0126|nr:glutathione peroxidase [Zunongwangia sp. HGR-M22]WBL25173.1 glutathione peroxidase [Zunongwangia sp. HGR-M22]